MWGFVQTWFREQPQQASIALFFLWGVAMSTLSGGMGTIWTLPILLLIHTISGWGIYLGVQKNSLGKRGLWGLGLNSLSMIYNLSLDILWVIF